MELNPPAMLTEAGALRRPAHRGKIVQQHKAQ
jgi:hypothetical protein